MGVRRVPGRVMGGVPRAARAGVVRWWEGLGEAERAELALMWSVRWERVRNVLERGEGGEAVGWRVLEVEPWVDGSVVEEEEAAREGLSALYWRLVARGEIRVKRRQFHVGCTQHREARACWERGVIPAGFACPLGRGACWMRGIVEAAGGGAVRLRGSEAWSRGRAVGVWVVEGRAEAEVEVGGVG